MNNQQPNASGEKKENFKKTAASLLRRLGHNWQWKLLSIVLAVCIWGVLVTQDDSLPRTKSFSNLKVNIANSVTLRQNGMIVVGGLEDVEPVDITVQLPQKYYASATADRYQIRADLSQIKNVGTQEIPLTASVTNASAYGTVTSISTPTITVEVERYISRSRVPVQLNITGETPEGFYAAPPVCDPETVEVAGPQSLVNSIVRCVVDYDMSILPAQAGIMRNSLPFVFLDRAGNVVDSSLLTVTNQGISMRYMIVEQALYPTIEVPVNQQSLIFGQPAPGYAVTAIKVEPETVILADDDLSMFQTEHASLYTLGRVNITNESQTKTDILTLNNRGVAYISHPSITVTVEISPLEEAE